MIVQSSNSHLQQLSEISLAYHQEANPLKLDLVDECLVALDATTLTDAVEQLVSLQNISGYNIAIPQGQERGLSDAKVFLVKDSNDTLLMVVKAFPNKTELLAELYGVKLLRALDNSQVSSPQPIEVASCSVEGKDHALLAMTPAEGSSISSYIIDISKGLSSPGERQYTTAYKVMWTFGQGLANLHNAQRNDGSMPLSLSEMIRGQCAEGIHYLRQHPIDNITVDPLEKRVNCLWTQNTAVHIALGLIHYEASPNNVFVEIEKGKVTFIDLGHMQTGVSNDGQAIGSLGYDVAHSILGILYRASKCNIPPYQQDEFIRQFENGYSSTGGKLPSPEERELYMLWEALRIIAKFSNNPALDDERLEKLKVCTAKLQEISVSSSRDPHFPTLF